MVKKLSGLMAIAVLSMGLLTATNINSTTEFYSDDLVESTKDFMKNPGVKYLNETVFNTNEAVEYSKTYTQYGLDSEGRYCLRFATAVKGNIETLSYTRGKVASLNKEEVTKPVDVIYNGIKSGEEISYYDGTDLTTDSQYAGNYYWACYTICFTDKALYDTDVTVNLNINGTALPSKTGNLASLISADETVMVEDVILEAEAGLLDFGSCYKGNSLAHGGAYVGSIDNAGQGVYYNYFSYVAGTFEMECYYTTGSVGSFNDIYVNGVKQGSFLFDTNTGWGSADRFETAKATAEITLNKGWNTILIKKDGDSSNNYGGWGELDYFVIKSNGMSYNKNDFIDVNTVYAPSYRLEAELATHVYKDGNQKWQASGKAPTKGNASNGYYMAGLDNPGEGMEWHFNAPVAGNYEVTLSFASDNANNPTDVMFYHSTQTLRGANFDATSFNETIMHLDTGSGWGNFQENTQKITLSLEQGENFIYAVKDNNWFFQADYIDIVYLP